MSGLVGDTNGTLFSVGTPTFQERGMLAGEALNRAESVGG